MAAALKEAGGKLVDLYAIPNERGEAALECALQLRKAQKEVKLAAPDAPDAARLFEDARAALSEFIDATVRPEGPNRAAAEDDARQRVEGVLSLVMKRGSGLSRQASGR